MADKPPRTALGPGALIALSIGVGTAVGVAYGQPSVGLIGGVVIGAVISVILYLIDRR